MRKRKYIKMLAVSMAASLMMPFVVSANDGGSNGGFFGFLRSAFGAKEEREVFKSIWNLTQGSLPLSACEQECEHWVTGIQQNESTEVQPNVIEVTGGEHTIVLDGVKINASVNNNVCPIKITNNAIVHLKLVGENVLQADQTAGILVGKNATLTIDTLDGKNDTGTLRVSSKNGAGIGANNTDNFEVGTIEINHGTINAKGGNLGAGIGGNGSGAAGTIRINGGIVNAEGGDNKSSKNVNSPGIGCGANGVGGVLEINGGTVSASSGTNKNGYAASWGINGVELISKENTEVIVDSTIGKDTNTNKFNGILKKNDGSANSTYYVYGTTMISNNKFPLSKDETMELQSGASLTIPDGWTPEGEINGDKTTSIVNANNFGADHGPINGEITLKVLMSADTIAATGLPYIGEDYNGENPRERAIVVLDKVKITSGSNAGEYIVDQTGWDLQPTIERKPTQSSSEPWQDTGGVIKEAGYYRVTYKRKANATTKEPIVKNLTISPQSLIDGSSKPRVNITPISNQEYTGEQIKPELEIKFPNGFGQDIPLIEGKDYDVDFGENKSIGTGTVTIKAIEPGNFTNGSSNGVTVEFTITAATIPESAVTVTPESVEYNGEQQNATIKVEMNNKELTPTTDYIITKNETPATQAGSYAIEIEGQGNYQGTVNKTFVIKKRELGITSVTAKGRQYEENNREVEVEKVTLDPANLADKDKDKFGTDGFIGIVEGSVTALLDSPNVREDYDKVAIQDITLNGSGSTNYTIKTPITGVMLDPPVAITKADPPAAPKIKGHIEVGEDGKTFRYVIDEPENIKVNDEVVYRYGFGTKEEAEAGKIVCKLQKGEKAYFDDIELNSKLVFAAHKAGTSNVQEGKIGYTEEIVFTPLPQAAPVPSEGEKFILKFEPGDKEGTFTATVSPKPKKEDASSGEVQYRFKEADGEWGEWQDEKTLEKCKPNTAYTAQVRFAGNDVYADGKAAETESTLSPKLKIEKPKIDPETAGFIGSQKVTIECETEGVTIYYTTDGTDPDVDSKEYTGPFVLEESSEVRAIAVKEGMENSDIAIGLFTKAEGDLFTKLTIKKDIKEVAEGLKDTECKTPEDIKQKLCRILAAIEGYNYLDMAYYDVSLKISADNEHWEVATVDNFPKEGLKITMPWSDLELPDGVGKDSHDFAVSHMFTATSKRLEVTAGETEEPEVKKTDAGLEFTIKSTSPVAVAWKKTAKSSTNNNNSSNNTANGGTGTNNSTNKNNGTTTGAGSGTKAGTTNGGTTKAGTNGTGTDANSKNGANGANGTNANGENQDGVLSSILPKTGDTASIMIWIVLGILSIAAVIAIIVKKKR